MPAPTRSTPARSTGDSYLYVVDMLDLGVPDALDETIVPASTSTTP